MEMDNRIVLYCIGNGVVWCGVDSTAIGQKGRGFPTSDFLSDPNILFFFLVLLFIIKITGYQNRKLEIGSDIVSQVEENNMGSRISG